MKLCQINVQQSQPILSIACVAVPDFTLNFVFDLRYTQTWNLIKLGIGDLSSTIGLAPSEKLTLEFQSTQRRLFEQSSLDSAEAMSSDESTRMDKEAMNVTRASSKTQNWHIDASGSVSIGPLSATSSAGLSGSTTQSAQQTISHATETSRKSAHSLKTMHKIEVRGVAETILTNRMTRNIVNPYRDRTMSVNVFQLVKHFFVETKLAELRPALLITIHDLSFDDNFVIAYADFLQQELTDPGLVSELPQSIQGASPVATDAIGQAANYAAVALAYLYDVPNVFNVTPVFVSGSEIDPNSPATSFDARNGLDLSGLVDAIGDNDSPGGNTAVIFTILGVYYQAYKDRMAGHSEIPDLLALATSLAADVGPKWQAVQQATDDKRIRFLMDENALTEIFRRLSGFLTMVNGVIAPLMTRADEQTKALNDRAASRFALDRLESHLHCNRHYYIQRFLSYLGGKTLGLGITDFSDLVLGRASVGAGSVNSFDVERAFVDRDTILIPWYRPLAENEVSILDLANGGDDGGFRFADVMPQSVEVEVPTDGIHLEVSAGACILANVPEPAGCSLDLNVKDATLQLGQ